MGGPPASAARWHTAAARPPPALSPPTAIRAGSTRSDSASWCTQLGHRTAVVESGRERVLGGQPVVHAHDQDAGLLGQPRCTRRGSAPGGPSPSRRRGATPELRSGSSGGAARTAARGCQTTCAAPSLPQAARPAASASRRRIAASARSLFSDGTTYSSGLRRSVATRRSNTSRRARIRGTRTAAPATKATAPSQRTILLMQCLG